MGLCLYAKGYDEDIYDSGYGIFNNFRISLAKAYNKELGLSYEKWIESLLTDSDTLSDQDKKNITALHHMPIGILLFHSDCEGKLTSKECKAIYEVTKDLKCDFPFNGSIFEGDGNQLEYFNKGLEHCIKNKVCLFFG